MRREVENYFNTGCLSRRDTLLSAAFPKVLFQRNGGRFLERVRKSMRAEGAGDVREVRVDVYSGTNMYVHQMAKYVQSELADDLVGAYVHGSLATEEEIRYSDFDALAIIRDEVFDRRSRMVQTAKKLSAANRIMLRFDPLQHHGWFVLLENDLLDYPQDYFPYEILRTAKSLLPHGGTSLTLRFHNEKVDYARPLFDATGAIVSRLRVQRYPRNVFELKGLLSRFMLVPALFCAAVNRAGICKKDCFEMARSLFDGDTYRIMDEVSHIRATWNYDLSAWRRYLLTRNRRGVRKLATKLAPSIPSALQAQLTERFYQRMQAFCLACHRSIDAHAVH
jgi:hypothetical protein